MARLKNVSDAEISALVEQGFDIAQTAGDVEKRVGQGYCDEIAEPIRKAAGLISASRALADLAAVLLMKAQLGDPP